MAEAVKLLEGWARERIAGIDGASLEVVQLEGPHAGDLHRHPRQGHSSDSVMLYGHLDKQPEMKGWAEGLGPWIPVIQDDRLYGRGGADDGYAMFGALTAILALREQSIAHARCTILIEACEESGSYDLPIYVDHLADRMGSPSLVVCLDSGCGDYERLWLTTSLRGIAMGNLTVRVLTEGVHSGDASGIVPSSFRIVRQLLSRIEDEATGRITLDELYAQVPPERLQQAKDAAAVLGDAVYSQISLRGRHQADGRGPGRTGAEPHLAAAARGDGHGWAAGTGERRQCASALHHGEAVLPPAADRRCRTRRRR